MRAHVDVEIRGDVAGGRRAMCLLAGSFSKLVSKAGAPSLTRCRLSSCSFAHATTCPPRLKALMRVQDELK